MAWMKLRGYGCVITSRPMQYIFSSRSSPIYGNTLHKRLLMDDTKMKKAYILYHENAEQFQLCLHYTNIAFRVNRQFNFSRQVSENVSVFISRIISSLDKTLSKLNKKRKQKSLPTLPEITVVLTVDGNIVPGDIICKDVIFGPGRVLLNILGEDYTLIINAPWIQVLTLPSCIMSEFPVYPSKFELAFATREDCVFTWYKKSSAMLLPRLANSCTSANASADLSQVQAEDNGWIEAGKGYFYVPALDDIGCHLKLSCLPINGSHQGPVMEIVSKTSIEAGPGDCPFHERHIFTADRLQDNSFRAVSYNILADMYADSEVARTQLYPYCAPYALQIDYRKQLVLKEIIGYNADIVCLQEVDSSVYSLDLLPVLSSLGFQAVFHKKSGRVSEGLACLFHSSKFKLVSSNSFYLAEDLQTKPLFNDVWNVIKNQAALVTRFTDRNTCVQVTVLDSLTNPSERLVVGNTHLYFHPNADHIRLLQAGMVVRYLQDVAANSACDGKRVTVLMCGDFNSTPECGVFRLMTTQHVGEDCIDWTSTMEEAVGGVSLTHSLPFKSACGTPDFTNFTVGFSGCLDYIFYQHDHLDVTQVVPLPSLEDVTLHTALPSVVFPSDHVALVADLQWKL